MSRPVYLSALREKNLKEGAPYPNLAKLEKCFAMFTRVTNGINLFKRLDRLSASVLVEPVDQNKSMSTWSSEYRRAEMNWLPVIEEIDSVISDAVIDRRCREWPPPKCEACMRSVSKYSEKFSKQLKHHIYGASYAIAQHKS